MRTGTLSKVCGSTSTKGSCSEPAVAPNRADSRCRNETYKKSSEAISGHLASRSPRTSLRPFGALLIANQADWLTNSMHGEKPGTNSSMLLGVALPDQHRFS